MKYDGYKPDPYGTAKTKSKTGSVDIMVFIAIWLVLNFGFNMLINSKIKKLRAEIAELREVFVDNYRPDLKETNP